MSLRNRRREQMDELALSPPRRHEYDAPAVIEQRDQFRRLWRAYLRSSPGSNEALRLVTQLRQISYC